MVKFTKHALEKFEILRSHGIELIPEQIEYIVKQPKTVDYSRLPQEILVGELDKTHYLRVVVERENETVKVITFYPARKKKYVGKI